MDQLVVITVLYRTRLCSLEDSLDVWSVSWRASRIVSVLLVQWQWWLTCHDFGVGRAAIGRDKYEEVFAIVVGLIS